MAIFIVQHHFKVEFNKSECRWNFLGIDKGKNISEIDEKFCHLIHSFLNEQWQGTATELCDLLKEMDSGTDITPRSIAKKLESVSEQLLADYAIDFRANRSSKGKNICLGRVSR